MKIFIDINGKTTIITFKQRNGIVSRIKNLVAKEQGDVKGRVKISYGKGFDNEFEYDSLNELSQRLPVYLEKELLKLLGL